MTGPGCVADGSVWQRRGTESQRPLEELLEDLRAKGVKTDAPIMDEDFGRSVVLQDPDGLRIQVNEHDRSLYT